MSKAEADGLNKLDVNWLMRHKIIENHCSHYQQVTWTHRPSGRQSSIDVQSSLLEGECRIKLSYTTTDRFDGASEKIDYFVPLTSTPCYFGGLRYWFICPLSRNGVYCGRRVAKLYLINKYFGCRHCHNLTYGSRNLSGFWKTIGNVVSLPEIEEQEQKIKRKEYAGKLTKKYRKFLYTKEKGLRQMMIANDGLNAYRKG
jgi:hypothetical protein